MQRLGFAQVAVFVFLLAFPPAKCNMMLTAFSHKRHYAVLHKAEWMNLRKILCKETVLLDLKSSTKEQIIEEMIDFLVAAGKIREKKDSLKAVIDRERKMSTGMQNGIAIPHGKTDKVDTLVAAIAVKKDGADFGSLDGQLSKIFVMTLSPDTRTGPHIQFLAEISRQLNDQAVREKILNATKPEDVLDALSGGPATATP